MYVLKDVYSTFKYKVGVLLLLTFVSAVMEGMTIAVLVPLFAILDLGNSSDGFFLRHLLEVLEFLGIELTVFSIGSIFASLLLVSGIVFVCQAKLATQLQSAYSAQWQTRLLKSLTSANWSHLRDLQMGHFASVIATDAPKTGSVFYQLNLIITSIIFIGTQAIIALLVAPTVTVLLVLLAAFLFLLTSFLTARAKRDGRILSDSNAELLGSIGEVNRALKFIKATSTEGVARAKIEPAIDKIRQAAAASAFDTQLVKAIFDYGGGATIAALLILGPSLFSLSLSGIIVVVAIFVRLFPKVTAMRQCYQGISLVIPSLERCARIEAEAAAAFDEHESYMTPERKLGPQSSGTIESAANIRMDNVGVVLGDGNQICSELSLNISSGDWVAVVGPSGAGKTTLIDLVLGLTTPKTGSVHIDDQKLLPENSRAWRSQVGYLGQDPVVFSGSILENLSWGHDGLLDQDMATKALEQAAAANIRDGNIAGPNIGELGATLSGGERQRIALARALANRPRLLVLDEATSALDPQAEQRIVESLKSLKGQVTILMTAHRLWSIKHASQIIVLESGKITQRGTFTELMDQRGWFRDMALTQA